MGAEEVVRGVRQVDTQEGTRAFRTEPDLQVNLGADSLWSLTSCGPRR